MRALRNWKWTRIVLAVLAVAFLVRWFVAPEPAPFPGSGEPMTAIVYHEYGSPDVLRLEQIEKPLPDENQVLIRVRAAGANPLDWHYMRGKPYIIRPLDSGMGKPKVTRLGADVSGEIVAVGKGVTRFKPGDEVFGTARGAYADYAIASQDKVVPKPATLTFEQAAAIPVAALTALQALRDKGHLQPGQKVLINGASGGVGTFAVQIAKSMGAEVTGVCSTRNVDMVRSIGADHVIDYKTEDFTQGAEKYDLILDNVANHSLSAVRRVMAPNGTYVQIGGGGPDDGNWVGPLIGPIKMLLMSPFVSQELVSVLATVDRDDLLILSELVESGKVTPVIDRTYALRDVPEAMRYLETGRARGKVVIEVPGGNGETR